MNSLYQLGPNLQQQAVTKSSDSTFYSEGYTALHSIVVIGFKIKYKQNKPKLFVDLMACSRFAMTNSASFIFPIITLLDTKL